MILFQKKQIEYWKQEQINDISCVIIQSGCAGYKLSVTPGIHTQTDMILEQDGIYIHIESRYSKLYENARATEVQGKWILTSEQIGTRCGCGSSFSISTGNPIQDKISQLKLKMKKKKEGLIDISW